MVFGIVTLVGAIVALSFYPETKGKTLEQIDDLFLTAEEKKFRELEETEAGLSRRLKKGDMKEMDH